MTILTTDRPVETELPVDYASGYRSGLLAAYLELRDESERADLADVPERTTYQHALDHLAAVLREHSIPAPAAATAPSEDLWAEDVDADHAGEEAL